MNIFYGFYEWFKDVRVSLLRERREEEVRKINRKRKYFQPPTQFKDIQVRQARKQLIQHQRR